MYKTKQSPHDSWSSLSLYIVLIVYDHFERDWNDCCSCKSNSAVLPGNLSYCSWKAHEHICKCVFFIKRIKPFDVSWNRNEGGHHLRHVVRSFLRMDTSSSIVPYLTYVTYLFKPEPQSSPQPFFVHLPVFFLFSEYDSKGHLTSSFPAWLKLACHLNTISWDHVKIAARGEWYQTHLLK